MLRQWVDRLKGTSQPKPEEPIPLEVRPLQQQTAGPLKLLELLSFLMDRQFEIPGTKFRFGWNTIFLFLPVIGDVVPGLISLGILLLGLTHYKVPRIVAARMTVNSLLDTAISAIPVVGNVWDVLYKADTRNVRLLKEYVAPTPEQKPRPLWHHWAFLIGAGLALVAVVALSVWGVYALQQMMIRSAVATSGR
jgi:hypothetical protein